MDRIVVVGASVAGLTAAEALREEGFSGEVVLVNGERHAGYDRPPLSKRVLSGLMQTSELMLRPADFYSAHRIDHRLGVRADQLDLQARIVRLETGERIDFDGLIIATGLRARPLRGQPSLRGLHMLRTLEDAQQLRTDLLQAKRVVVVGAGFLGSEVAATARELGLHVTLVDPLALPMLTQLGSAVAAAVQRTHSLHGVEMRTSCFVQRFCEQDGHVTGVVLDSGEQLDAQVVFVAVGSIPNTEWLRESALRIEDGVVCDEFCRAAEGVYAAGDVAKWWHPQLARLLRVEHRMHASQQGIVAARNLLGARVAFDAVPYFWTDFYDVKIQVFGQIAEADAMTVLTGEVGARSFTAAYARDGIVTAVLGWSAAREVRRISTLVGQPAAMLKPLAPVNS